MEVRLELADDAHFVFGGDTVDHGGRDIGVLSTLLDLKRRHPSRVHFLLGNRDINKMRLSAELESADLDRDPAEIPAQYWLPASQRLPLARFLDTVAVEASTHVERISKSISFVPTSQRAAPQKPVPEQEALRLRWILRYLTPSNQYLATFVDCQRSLS